MTEATLDSSRHDEWERLNAFVDGEMPADERERLRTRARLDPLFAVQVAGLRHLKADLRAGGRRSRMARRTQVAIAVAATCLASIVLGAAWIGRGSVSGMRADPTLAVATLADILAGGSNGEAPQAVSLAVFDLSPAGFRLLSVVAPAGVGPILVYEGLHGCRIGLMTGAAAPTPQRLAARDMEARTWVAGTRRFTLVANRMDPDRFAHMADGLELLTRGGDADQVVMAFRLSNQGRRCVG